MEGFLTDIAQTVRSLRNSPGFTFAAVATLALGIGANTAIFSVVDTVLLKPFQVPDADRIVWFSVRSVERRMRASSPTKFQHLRQQTDVVEDVTALRSGWVNYTGGDIPEQLRSTHASANYFRLFRAPIVLGRGFSDDEDLPNGPRVALISQQLWERRFDSDTDVLGRAISISGDEHTIIGVVGDGLDLTDFGIQPQVWTPFQLDPNTSEQGDYFFTLGRLRPGVSLAQARIVLELSSEVYRNRFPDALQEGVFYAETAHEVLVGYARSSLFVLMGAVGFVLLIACANVANLLLVRATTRKRELAVRAALGAGRRRIVRQLLTESLLLSLAGGAMGLFLGVAGIRGLLAINTAELPRIGEEGALVGLDWRVVTFTLLVSLATGVVFGLVPSLRGSRSDLSGTLKESSSRSGTGFRQNKMLAVLVITEVALALVLLIGSALLIRTLGALQGVDPGWDANNVLTTRMSLTGDRFATTAAVALLVRNGIERLEALPGVETASATCSVPLQEDRFGMPFIVVGRPLDGPSHGDGEWASVSPGYFEVFRIAVRRGRAFTDKDTGQAPPVAIINETMAERFWPEGDPFADRLVIGRGALREFADEPERQIVGIVADTRDVGLNWEPQAKMYIPQAQQPDAVNALISGIGPMAWIVRTRTNPQALIPTVEEELRQVSGLSVADLRTMDDMVLRSTSRQRFNMWLMTAFAGAALLLAAIGVYGVIAYSVEQRTHEIGIRLALGAEATQVRRMVVVQGMRLVAVGVVIGLALAIGLARVIESFLFGVETWDPTTFVTVPAVLASVALVAVLVPAHRASRVNPVDVLRHE